MSAGRKRSQVGGFENEAHYQQAGPCVIGGASDVTAFTIATAAIFIIAGGW
jgi:hypothetical protein